MDSQPEFTKSIWDYLDILVNDNRLAKGREILAKYKPQFDAVEKAYGVDRYIIAAIWGMESNYSTQMGDRSVRALHRDAGLRRPPPGLFQGRIPLGAGNPAPWRSAPRTDARLLGRRFRPDPVHADRVQALRRRFRSATAAATWSTIRRPDRLHRQQPEKGRLAAPAQTWGYEVVVPAELQLHAGRPRPGDDDRAMGASRRSNAPTASRSRIRPSRPFCWSPAGAAGARLPDAAELSRDHAIQPGGGLCAGDRPFRRPAARRRALRAALAAAGAGAVARRAAGVAAALAQRGFYRGTPDGQFGGETRNALRSFQASIGAPADGFASSDVLERLRGH